MSLIADVAVITSFVGNVAGIAVLISPGWLRVRSRWMALPIGLIGLLSGGIAQILVPDPAKNVSIIRVSGVLLISIWFLLLKLARYLSLRFQMRVNERASFREKLVGTDLPNPHNEQVQLPLEQSQATTVHSPEVVELIEQQAECGGAGYAEQAVKEAVDARSREARRQRMGSGPTADLGYALEQERPKAHRSRKPQISYDPNRPPMDKGDLAEFIYVDHYGEVSDRRVQNWRIVGKYIEGVCLTRKAYRQFRLDRVDQWVGWS